MFVFRVSILLILIAAAVLRPVTSRDAIARSGPRVVSAATSGQGQILGAAKGRPSFVGPTGLAADAQGNVYVANTGANSIVKVSHTGQLLATWGTARTSPIQYDRPNGVALDVHGNIYVADTGNSRVVKLSPTGMPLARWGTRGIGPRQFDLPSATALDSQGNIYVADTGNHRVVKLSPAGPPLAQWNTNVDNSDPNEQVTEMPQAIAVSVTGTVYVQVEGTRCYTDIGKCGSFSAQQRWSTGGKYLGDQAFAFPGGNLVTTDSHGEFQVHGSTSDPFLKLVRRLVGRALGTIAVDRAGNVYIINRTYGRVYKFSPNGATLARWGTSGADAGRFFMPRAIAIDAHGNIYVADAGNNRLQELSPRGLPIATWLVSGPTSVAVDARGTIYVGAGSGSLFRKPANARTLTPWILMPRSMSGIPSALAVDTHGYVYLTGDFGPRFIQKISPAGVLLTRFRLSGQTAGRVARVAVDRAFGSIAIDRKGNIYAPDAANNGIRKL